MLGTPVPVVVTTRRREYLAEAPLGRYAGADAATNALPSTPVYDGERKIMPRCPPRKTPARFAPCTFVQRVPGRYSGCMAGSKRTVAAAPAGPCAPVVFDVLVQCSPLRPRARVYILTHFFCVPRRRRIRGPGLALLAPPTRYRRAIPLRRRGFSRGRRSLGGDNIHGNGQQLHDGE